MIIPEFKTSQSVESITVVITAPFCNISELDWTVSDSEFLFSCDPYHLRIDFGNDLEEDTSNCSYDVDEGAYTFTLVKVFPEKEYKDVNWLNGLNKTRPCQQSSFLDPVTPVVIPVTPEESSDDECDFESDEVAFTIRQIPYGFGWG